MKDSVSDARMDLSTTPLTAKDAEGHAISQQNALEVHRWQLLERVADSVLFEVHRACPLGASDPQRAPYVLKLLRSSWQQKPEAVEVVRREALVGMTVSHPHLVPVLAANAKSPPYFVVTPWLAGTTLDRQLGSGQLDLPEALWVVRQASEALEALDRHGWTHGDIKPSNIRISAEGHVTLLDLGFARRQDETGSVIGRCFLGTGNYLAPESITSAFQMDIRSDIYSLGVVLFQLLAGRLPFEGRDLAELATQHRQAQPPDLRRLAPHLPAAVVRLVREMLAKQPLRRPQTPQELTRRLMGLEISTFGERACY